MLHMLSCLKLSRLTSNKLETWRNVGGKWWPTSTTTNYQTSLISELTTLRCTGLVSGPMSAGLRSPGHLTKKVLSPTKKCWHSGGPWNKCFRKQFSDTRKCNAIYILYCASKFSNGLGKYLLATTKLIFRMNVITWSAPFLGKLTGKVPINIPYSGEHCQQETGNFPS